MTTALLLNVLSQSDPSDFSDLDSMGVPRKHSYLSWLFAALGFKYTLLLPLAGLLVFFGACVVVVLARRPSVLAAFLLLLPLPLLLGVFATIEGVIAAAGVVRGSAMEMPNAMLLEVLSTSLVSTWVGMLVNAPAYFVMAAGLLFRTITHQPER